MQRYFIYIAYNGGNYCGWQIQPNGNSVQQEIETALMTLLRRPVSITGAGRTDAGVHARQMVAHFDWEQLSEKGEFTERLNRILPKDIAIHQIREVAPEAHARFGAISREYQYFITTKKDAFEYPFQYKINHPLDVEKMNQAAQILFEYNDFTSFSKLHTDVKTNLCEIKYAHWTKEEELYTFTIRADRFLRNMVRAIVGTMLDIGRDKLSLDGFRTVIEDKDRCKAGTSVPGQALFLTNIEYPENLFTL
jgi:pseudouridylate synthase I